MRPLPICARLLCLLPLLCTLAFASKPTEPVLVIPTEPLGFQIMPARLLASGATLYTLHFVDEHHLLYTFNTRTLLSRLPDATADDEDRNVAAILLELPSGRVLARTEWRTRDRDRYLWPLTHGRFLLRVRSRLTIIDPLANLAAGNAFHEQTFVDVKRRVGFISVSPVGDLLAIETLPKRKPALIGAAASAAALAATVPGARPQPAPEPEDDTPGHSRVQIFFYRLHFADPTSEPSEEGKRRLTIHFAGLVGAPNLIIVPATGEGFLDMKKESSHTWLFDFVSHSGKRLELAAFDTSCAPHPTFVSRSEFISFGCRGSDDRQQLSYFNLKGEEPWLQVLSGTHISPTIATAPAAGRFAVSRILMNSTLFNPENISSEEITAQELTVFQNHDGRPLLKLLPTPIQRAGQNFDFAPSGLAFATIRNGNIEIYKLPALSGQDDKNLKYAAALAPEANDANIKLTGIPAYTADAPTESAPEAAPAPVVATEPAKAAPALPAPVADPTSEPRTPPTLYTPDHPR